MVPEDLQPSFRADMVQLSLLPELSLTVLADILLEDAKQQSPTRISTLASVITKELGVPEEQSRALARGGRSIASQLAKADDKPADVADDLVSLQIVPQEKRQGIYNFLVAIQRERSHFVARASRLGVSFSGGYHLASVSVFSELRAVFAESEISRNDIEKYVPVLLGLLPAVTLQLDLHGGDEDSKSISLRLSEVDLTDLENALKKARLQISELKKKSQGA